MMEPDQVRERMEMFGLGNGKKESDLFLKDVCDSYEEMFYQLIEKKDKVSTLNDAVKYYKNMEDNMKQMLSTISEISEKTEHAASKSAELTKKEAQQQADVILADASQKAAQILEDAKQQAQELVDDAREQAKDTREEFAQIKGEFDAYAVRFYDFLEAQKAYFKEHNIDVERARQEAGILTVPAGNSAGVGMAGMETVPVQAGNGAGVGMAGMETVPVQAGIEAGTVPYAASQMAPGLQNVSPAGQEPADAAAGRIRKIPNAYGQTPQPSQMQPAWQTQPAPQTEPTIEEIQANIPEHIRNIQISDHTETLDEIIQSIKRSYEEVENK